MQKLKDILSTVGHFFADIFKKLFKLIKDHKEIALLTAVIIILAIVVITVFVKKSHGDSTFGANEKYAVNKDDELNALILNYYYAYSTGDINSIKIYATPVSEEELSYIQFYSQFIDAFENVKLYTKRGLTEGSYLVSAYVDLKFTGIEKAAPGLDFFYVETNDDGALYINNLYGSFNQSNGVYDMDATVTSLIAQFEQQSDVVELQQEVQKKCDDAVNGDEALSNFVNTTLADAIITWSTEFKTMQAQKREEEAAAAEAAAKAEAEAKEEANAFSGTASSTLNVRALASKDGTVIGTVTAGTKLKIYAQEGDWYKIEYDNRKAYVAAQYVTVDSDNKVDNTASNTNSSTSSTTPGSSTDSTSGSTSGFAEGTKITMKTTCNMRASMSTESDIVGKAYEGQQVTVIMSYAEGWTKVKNGSVTGFIKTSLLQ